MEREWFLLVLHFVLNIVGLLIDFGQINRNLVPFVVGIVELRKRCALGQKEMCKARPPRYEARLPSHEARMPSYEARLPSYEARLPSWKTSVQILIFPVISV